MDVYFQYDQILNEWRQLQEIMNQSYDEWKAFLESGKIKPDSQIRPEILSSWVRCRERGQDPFNTEPVILSDNDLKAEIHSHKDLIDAATPIANEIVEQISSIGFCLDLYSTNLYLIARYKRANDNRESFDQVKRRPIPLGVSNQEKDSGTTAVNLAALLKCPTRLVAYDHYCTQYHNISTLGVPILDSCGKLQGVLAAECLNWPMHRHTMSMLVAAKWNIEKNLQLNTQSNTTLFLQNTLNTFLREGFADSLFSALEAPSIVVDASNRVSYISEDAKKQLKIGIPYPVGFSCEELWGPQNPFTVTRQLKKFAKRDTTLTFGDQQIPIRIAPIYDKNHNFFGLAGFLKRKQVNLNVNNTSSKLRAYYTFENLIGEDPAFRQAIRLAKEVANLRNNVLIQGESGTGKELFAQAIHNAGPYKDGPFVAVNCSAIPQTLLESELFGYEGGSFTGAKRDGSIGKFEQADGGTILLDEINSMPLKMQAAILRVIQTKKIVRVGGSTEKLVSCRILTASNVKLWDMVKAGTFREDLYYRINAINLNIPPLRQRKDDIELLAQHIINRLDGPFEKRLYIEDNAMALMKSYPWPGNVRELENVLERSCILVNSRGQNTITTNDLMSYEGIREFLNSNHSSGPKIIDLTPKPLEKLTSVERDIILKELESNAYNISRTAEKLGVARNTLYRKLKKYNIDISPFK